MKKFSPFDYNNDEINEINSLVPLEPPLIRQKPLDDNDNLLLVIVNPKLLQTTYSSRAIELQHWIEVFREDLDHAGCGYNPRIIIADLYSGDKHQDGRVILAMRRFFQEVRKCYPNFQGAIFIGPFPEAFIVRTCARRMTTKFYPDATVINHQLIQNQDYLRIWPDVIATRSDIVLCDLDGDWDSMYSEGKTMLPSLLAIPQGPLNLKGSVDWASYGSESIIDYQKGGGFCIDIAKCELNPCTEEFEDFFHINDGQFKVWQEKVNLAGIEFFLTNLEIFDRKDLEVSQNNLSSPNPIANPTIIVSRIDAGHVAVVPNPHYPSETEESIIDTNGNPKEITAKKFVSWFDLYTYDPELECRLIIDYLKRNHLHRTSSSRKKTIYALIAGPGFTKGQLVSEIFGSARTEYWGGNDPPDGASVYQYVSWLGKKATVNGIITHANQDYFHFLDSTEDLDPILGKNPERWYWDVKHSKLRPGWKDLRGEVTMHVHKALWKLGFQYSKSGGRFYFADGCSVNSCNYKERYNSDAYAKGQLAESLLFYTIGLAVLARAKDYNDFPPNAYEIFDKQQKPFGEIWTNYFNSEMQNASLITVDRKRSYSWGIIGDWTLKIAHNP